MTKPRILVTTSTGQGTDLQRLDAVTGRNYSQSVARAGGLPFMVASLDPELAPELLEGADGVLFTGGVDVHPRHFGQEPSRDLGKVDTDRDAFELALYHAARQRGLPILGVCRGHQLINVAEAGSLHQHLSSDVTRLDHSQKAMGGEPHHLVSLEAGSVLASAFAADQVMTNSYHHQAIDRLAPALRAVAHSSDGLIEAVQGSSGAWLLGVQWHPEMSQERHPEQLAPFRAFIDAVSESRLVSA